MIYRISPLRGLLLFGLMMTSTTEAAPAARLQARLPAGYLELDRIVAVVAKDVVTKSDLMRAIGRHSASQSLTPTNAARPRDHAALKKQVLNGLVEERLVVQAAHKDGLTISDLEIDQQLKEMMQKNIWDQEELTEAVAKMGFATLDQYRAHIRIEKLRVNMLRKQLGGRLRITDTEIERVIRVDYEGGKFEQAVRCRHILLKVPQNANPSHVNSLRQKAWLLYDKIKAGGVKFSAAAEEHSDDLGTEEGGDLGFMRRWMLDPTFARTLWRLHDGQVSGVIQTPFGFHLIKRIAAKKVAVQDLRVLKQVVRAQLTEQAFTRLYVGWIKILKANTHIEIRL